MARLRENDDDLLHRTPREAGALFYSEPLEPVSTPGVYTRSSGNGKGSSYRERVEKDSERYYYNNNAHEDFTGMANESSASGPFNEPVMPPAPKRSPRPETGKKGDRSMSRPSYPHAADHVLPHELDVLWSGTRSLFKEDRPPMVVFSLGLLLGAGLTSAVFLLLLNRPVALNATTLTNPDSVSSRTASASMPLHQPAEQVASSSEQAAQKSVSGTRHLSLSRDGAIQASAVDETPAVKKDTSSIDISATQPVLASDPKALGKAANNTSAAPTLFGVKLVWPKLNLPSFGASSSHQALGGTTVQTVNAPVADSKVYEVQAGDTLGSIGYRLLGDSSPATVERIQAANHLSSPDKLALGQKLVIPTRQP